MMDGIIIVPLILAFVLSIVHYYFEIYASHLKKLDTYFISFSSALFITYIFLSMLPEMVKGDRLDIRGTTEIGAEVKLSVNGEFSGRDVRDLRRQAATPADPALTVLRPVRPNPSPSHA